MIRTVLGDIAPANLGVCYAHEHIIIDDSVATMRHPQFHLPSVENAIEELGRFHAAGGRAMVDCMPCAAGRNVLKLARISKATGVHILCPTGLHLPDYYDPGHWGKRCTATELAELFIADLTEGIDRNDHAGPMIERTIHRAGLIKIATGREITPRARRVFEAAAMAHRQTGSPILTHTEQGDLGLEQVAMLEDHGVDLHHVVLSHLDRKPDIAYHREILSSGVRVEYDSAFRWKSAENPTLDLVEKLLPEFPEQIMLGMDAARPAYWTSYGGSPGLSWLLNDFTKMMRSRGITDALWNRVFITNPASTYQFKHTPN
ncbi:MAG: phosphotriesterase family protein [Luteolibacter sp.]